jgi:hypothetical protein
MKPFQPIKYLFSFLVLVLLSQNCNAQFMGCKDSSKVNLAFPCPDPTYKPVCGCDGVTYRNICAAELQNGISPGQWRDGSCSGLEFDIFPTYTHDNLNFSFVQPQNVTTTANLVIIDQYGAMMKFQTLYPDLSGRVDLFITETAYYRPGVYIMFLYSGNGDYRYKKFVRY